MACKCSTCLPSAPHLANICAGTDAGTGNTAPAPVHVCAGDSPTCALWGTVWYTVGWSVGSRGSRLCVPQALPVAEPLWLQIQLQDIICATDDVRRLISCAASACISCAASAWCDARERSWAGLRRCIELVQHMMVLEHVALRTVLQHDVRRSTRHTRCCTPVRLGPAARPAWCPSAVN